MNASDRKFLVGSLERTIKMIALTDKKDKFAQFMTETLATDQGHNWTNVELKAYHTLASDYLLFLNR